MERVKTGYRGDSPFFENGDLKTHYFFITLHDMVYMLYHFV